MGRNRGLPVLLLIIGLILLACTITHSYAQDSSTAVSIDSSTSSQSIDQSSSSSSQSIDQSTAILSSSSHQSINHSSSTGASTNCTLTPNITECQVNCTLTPNIPECFVNCTETPTNPQCLVNCTLFPDDPQCYVPLPIPPTSQQILANASCPIINYRVNYPSINEWCVAGETDHNHCEPFCDVVDPSIKLLPHGIEQDSLYSPNPPDWWRCVYTKVEYINVPSNSTNNSTTNSTTEVVETSELVTVIDGNCATDSSKCVPLRYMSQVNTLNPITKGPQWLGQIFPPFKKLDRPAIAIVVANAGFVNMTLFYPFVDVLQLLQVQNSGNYSFLSGSVSTRIVVEVPGGVISPARMRINNQCGYVVPFFTLILRFSDGFPTSAEWEDDTSTCVEEEFVCSDDGSCNCGVPIWACIGYDNSTHVGTIKNSTSVLPNSIDCDLKIYLAYRGTDRDGNSLTSSSRTLKNFRKWSFGALYNNILNSYNNLPDVANSFGNCKQVVAGVCQD